MAEKLDSTGGRHLRGTAPVHPKCTRAHLLQVDGFDSYIEDDYAKDKE